MKVLRDFRILPVALVAVGSLLVLKMVGLAFDGGYVLGSGRTARAEPIRTEPPREERAFSPREPEGAKADGKRSWAQEVFGYPDITGSVPNSKAGDAPKAPEVASGKRETVSNNRPNECIAGVPLDLAKSGASPSERALLERLAQRRGEIEGRARELDMREGLLRAAEKRIEARINELKELEDRIQGGVQKRDEAETARLKGLVTMYESMKAKEAARIFDRLDAKVLFDVASQMNPRRLSDVLAQMSPEAAERLTVELAGKKRSLERSAPALDLPKIEGREKGA